MHQMMMLLSTLLLAKYLSCSDHAKSRISPACPRNMVAHRQFSTLFDAPELPKTVDGPTPRFHSIIILSSPPDANVMPFPDHRTQFTHAKWLSNWHSFFTTFGEFSAFSSITGSKFQITTRPASFPWPPVANFVPSGWISMENIGLSANKCIIIPFWQY